MRVAYYSTCGKKYLYPLHAIIMSIDGHTKPCSAFEIRVSVTVVGTDHFRRE